MDFFINSLNFVSSPGGESSPIITSASAAAIRVASPYNDSADAICASRSEIGTATAFRRHQSASPTWRSRIHLDTIKWHPSWTTAASAELRRGGTDDPMLSRKISLKSGL